MQDVKQAKEYIKIAQQRMKAYCDAGKKERILK